MARHTMRALRDYLAYREGVLLARRIAEAEGIDERQVLDEARKGTGPLFRAHGWRMEAIREALEARERFLEANRGLVRHHLYRTGAPPELWDDLEAAGMAALHRAMELYDPSRAEFSTYATMWIRQAVDRERKRLSPGHISLEESLPESEGLRIGDVLESEDPGPEEVALLKAEQEALRQKVWQAVREGRFSPEEARVLVLFAGAGEKEDAYPYDERELASLLGMKPRQVAGTLNRVFQRLREDPSLLERLGLPASRARGQVGV